MHGWFVLLFFTCHSGRLM